MSVLRVLLLPATCALMAALAPTAFAQSATASLTVVDTISGFTGEADVVGNSDMISNFRGRRQNYAAGYAISADGNTIVGASNTAAGVSRAFLLRAGAALQDLGSLSSGASFAASVNANGTVVVGHAMVDSSRWQAFRWSASGGMENLGTFAPGNAGFSTALDVSDDGEVVVGGAFTATTSDRAFRWTRATGMVNLGVLSGGSFSDALGVSGDGQVVVGVSAIASGSWRAFRWTQGAGMVDLGTIGGFAGDSAATSTNTDGSVVVGMSAANALGQRQAFRWTQNGGMVGLGTVAGGESIAHGVSGDGRVVVGSSGPSGQMRAFVWTDATGIQDLGALLASGGVDMTGIVLQSARGVSRTGQLITGAGAFSSTGGGTRAYVARLGGGGGGAGLTTSDAVARSISRLADSRTAQLATQMLVTSVHLGVNDQLSCAPTCMGAYLSFGSFNASAHGRHNLTPEWTLLGGLGIGYSDEPGVDVDLSASLAGAIRFDPDDRGASRPFFEAGLGLAPRQQVVYRRAYENGAALASGVGETEADFAQAYVRAGWVARVSPILEAGAALTLGHSWQRADAYSEREGAANPFAARFPKESSSTTTLSATTQVTRLIGARLEANANLTAFAMLEQDSSVRADVAGFGQVAGEGQETAWLQPGIRLGWRFSPRLVLDTFANATIGEKAIGTSVHGGFGITARF